MRRWLWAFTLWLCGVLGCGNQIPPPIPASFDRPGAVAFVCFRTQGEPNTPRPIPLEDCIKAQEVGGTDPNLSIHALVTQTSRGEVAAVDLQAGAVLDSRNDIPGFTFVRVGELPSAIVVGRQHPEITYVANAGSRDISVLKTRAFRKLAVGEDPALQTLRLTLPSMPSLGAQSPTAMVMSPDEDALFVAAADAHWLVRIPIRRCGAQSKPSCVDGMLDASAIARVPLELSLPQAVPFTAKGAEQEPYQHTCNAHLLPPPQQVSTSIPANAAKTAPRPIALAIDAFCAQGKPCKRRLIVADDALPIIHVLDLDLLAKGVSSAAVLPPIVTGVPTKAVAVTPHVPVSIDDAKAGETQYVYAIDSTDNSVIVTEGARVLSVSSDPGQRPDRVGLDPAGYAPGTAAATSLEVLTPRYDVTDPERYLAASWQFKTVVTTDSQGKKHSQTVSYLPSLSNPLYCTDDAHPLMDTARLRGVFLAVGVSDGTVRIVDVHDMATKNCMPCTTPVQPPYPWVYPVVRHRTRIAVSVDVASAQPALAPTSSGGDPYFTVSGAAFAVSTGGTINNPAIDKLECITCGNGKYRAYPDEQTLAAFTDAGVAPSSNPGVDASVLDGGMSNLDAAIDGATPNAAPDQTTAPAPCPDLDGEHQSRICAPADPWLTVGTWIATYEGGLPNTHGGHGHFVDAGSASSKSGSLELIGETDFCQAGVQGDADLGQHTGDQLVITSKLVTGDWPAGDKPYGKGGETLAEQCGKLVASRDAGETLIAFPIERAFSDRVVIGPTLIQGPPGVSNTSYAFVRDCFRGMLMTYEVHTRSTFTVIDESDVSFHHRVVTDSATGRCVEDKSQDPLRTGRAYPNTRFENTRIAFQINLRTQGTKKPAVLVPPPPGTRLTLGLRSSAYKVLYNANVYGFSTTRGVQPSFLRYNDIDGQLYMVDPAVRGLVPIPLDAFPGSSGTQYQ